MSENHNSEKSNRKLSKNLLQNGLISNEKGLPKPFKQYKMDGSFISKHKSAKEFCEIYGGSRGHISVVLSQRKLYYNNKIILFSNDSLSQRDIEYVNNKHKKKGVILFDLNDKFIKYFDTVKKCSNFIGCKDAEVRMCCLGKRGRIKTYKTKYYE